MPNNDWIYSKKYDDWKTSPPEPDDDESKIRCCKCDEPLYYDDEYYELDDEIFCEYCAEKWLEGHKNWVTEDMVLNGR